jgi:CubicO group peptidase (beta-lactamase class C family)
MPGRFDPVERLLTEAHAARGFPGAAIEVGRTDGIVWQSAVGRLRWDADAAPTSPSTLFDLASLTKVVVTASIALRLVGQRRLLLDTPVSALLPEWNRDDRRRISVADLLEHAAGLTAWSDCYRRAATPAEFKRDIASLPLAYVPRAQSLYSDLGFILLGFILEDTGDASLDAQFHDWLGSADLLFTPPADDRPRTAPTQDERTWRQRLLVGEVDDENCHALGGVAGHAGLFGTAPAVGTFARLVLRTFRAPTALGAPRLLCRFTRPSRVPGSSRALGWDRMRPTSSCGVRLSRSAIGHTGFTGTSLWIDPALDLYVVLLTNRVHPARPTTSSDELSRLRPRLHDAVVAALGN